MKKSETLIIAEKQNQLGYFQAFVEFAKNPIVQMVGGVMFINMVDKLAPDYFFSEKTRGIMQGVAIAVPTAKAVVSVGSGLSNLLPF